MSVRVSTQSARFTPCSISVHDRPRRPWPRLLLCGAAHCELCAAGDQVSLLGEACLTHRGNLCSTFPLSFGSLEPNEVGIQYDPVAQSLNDQRLYTSGRYFLGTVSHRSAHGSAAQRPRIAPLLQVSARPSSSTPKHFRLLQRQTWECAVPMGCSFPWTYRSLTASPPISPTWCRSTCVSTLPAVESTHHSTPLSLHATAKLWRAASGPGPLCSHCKERGARCSGHLLSLRIHHEPHSSRDRDGDPTQRGHHQLPGLLTDVSVAELYLPSRPGS